MEYRLKEILQDKGYIRGPFGSSLKRNELKSTGIPVYEQQHAIYATREFRYYIDKEKYSQMKRFTVKPNDLIISCSGTIGKVDLISEKDPIGIISQALLILRANTDIVLPEYLFYFFKSDYGYNSIISRSMGSVQVNIAKREVIENIKINIPSLKEQEKIVKILSNIDEKIKLNNQINDNLQELLLYKYNSYFQGKISNGKLKDIVLKTNRTIKKDKINESLKYYPIDVLPKNNIILQDGKSIEEAQSSLIEFNKNEILVGAMRVYFHRVCLTNNSGITRNTTFVLKPKDEDYLYYSLLTLYQDSFIDYASITSKGTTMPYAVWENVCSEFDIYIPTKEELEEFNIVCKAIINKMNINQVENQNLEQIRDTLLPKLMNGEIDLDKVEI